MDKNLSHYLSKGGGEERGNWDVWFYCDLNDWEMELVAAFTHILESNIPPSQGEDQMRWKFRKSRDFEIQSFYSVQPSSVSFLGKLFGKIRLPRELPTFLLCLESSMGEDSHCK